MKTYNERLNEIAEEFAIAEWDAMQPSEDKQWNSGYLEEEDKERLISGYMVSARIALKHMAEEFKAGHFKGAMDMANPTQRMTPLEEVLQSLGLIEPQTETI